MTIASAAFLAFGFLGGLFGLGSEKLTFDGAAPGGLPPEWVAVSSRDAPPQPHWEVKPDATAPSRPNVLAQDPAQVPQSEFALAVFEKVTCRDGDLSVKFKIAPGPRKIKTAGLVWRYQDRRNYYVLHFSVDESNIVMFRVQDGQAHVIPVTGGKPGGFGVSRELRTGEWYIARVIYRGSHVRVLFGNRRLFDAEDSSLLKPGKTAVWTKGGSAAEFDDFRIDRKG